MGCFNSCNNNNNFFEAFSLLNKIVNSIRSEFLNPEDFLEEFNKLLNPETNNSKKNNFNRETSKKKIVKFKNKIKESKGKEDLGKKQKNEKEIVLFDKNSSKLFDCLWNKQVNDFFNTVFLDKEFYPELQKKLIPSRSNLDSMPYFDSLVKSNSFPKHLKLLVALLSYTFSLVRFTDEANDSRDDSSSTVGIKQRSLGFNTKAEFLFYIFKSKAIDEAKKWNNSSEVNNIEAKEKEKEKKNNELTMKGKDLTVRFTVNLESEKFSEVNNQVKATNLLSVESKCKSHKKGLSLIPLKESYYYDNKTNRNSTGNHYRNRSSQKEVKEFTDIKELKEAKATVKSLTKDDFNYLIKQFLYYYCEINITFVMAKIINSMVSEVETLLRGTEITDKFKVKIFNGIEITNEIFKQLRELQESNFTMKASMQLYQKLAGEFFFTLKESKVNDYSKAFKSIEKFFDIEEILMWCIYSYNNTNQNLKFLSLN